MSILTRHKPHNGKAAFRYLFNYIRDALAKMWGIDRKRDEAFTPNVPTPADLDPNGWRRRRKYEIEGHRR